MAINKLFKYIRIGAISILIFLLIGFYNNNSTLQKENDELYNMTNEFRAIVETQDARINRSGFIDFTPTIKEVKNIIARDDSHLMKYDELQFNCVDFTHRVIQKYFEKGIYSCMTTLYFEDGLAHANVAINTSDRGVIYIEPQTKVILDELTLNKDYCDYVNFDCDEPWILIEYKSCFDDLRESVK